MTDQTAYVSHDRWQTEEILTAVAISIQFYAGL